MIKIKKRLFEKDLERQGDLFNACGDYLTQNVLLDDNRKKKHLNHPLTAWLR